MGVKPPRGGGPRGEGMEHLRMGADGEEIGRGESFGERKPDGECAECGR